MRKIYLLFFLFSFLCDGYLYSQNFEYSVFPPSKEKREKIKKRIAIRDSIDLDLEKRIANNNIARAGYYLRQSSILQYSALGCAAVSATFFLVGSKCEARLDQNGEVIDYGNRDVWRFCGYAAAAAGIMCEVWAIHFKWKAGKSLMLKSSPTGVTASFKFQIKNKEL